MKTIFNKPIMIAAFFLTTACAPQSDSEVRLADESRSETELLASEAPLQKLAPSYAELTSWTVPAYTDSEKTQVLARYAHLDPNKSVPTNLLEKAVLYYDANRTRIANRTFMTVIDFAKKSTKTRFYIIDMNNGSVWAMRTSHGKGSDANHDGYAEKFSNVSGSNATSLGFYLTAETYVGANGNSLRLDGLSATNSNARPRAIVIHGAHYVQEKSVIQGRSAGCPAVTHAYRDAVISRIKGGSLIYAGRSTVD